MELRQLRYLLAVAQEQNFTRAAETVFVSQSALSQQIQAMEQELNTILIDRSKRGAKLTVAGEILCRHAHVMFNELEQAQVAIQELEGLQRGELRIGVVQTVNDYFMGLLVTEFSQLYPNIRLFVEELPSEEIETRLKLGELQVGLSFIPVADANIGTQTLFDESLSLIVRDDHPLAHSSAVDVERLDQLPMVMLSHTFCTRQLWEESAKLVAAEPNVVMELNTVSSILTIVQTTGYATILPERTLEAKDTDKLKSIRLLNPSPMRQVGVLWNQANYLCAASRAFIDLAKQLTQA